MLKKMVKITAVLLVLCLVAAMAVFADSQSCFKINTVFFKIRMGIRKLCQGTCLHRCFLCLPGESEIIF